MIKATILVLLGAFVGSRIGLIIGIFLEDYFYPVQGYSKQSSSGIWILQVSGLIGTIVGVALAITFVVRVLRSTRTDVDAT